MRRSFENHSALGYIEPLVEPLAEDPEKILKQEYSDILGQIRAATLYIYSHLVISVAHPSCNICNHLSFSTVRRSQHCPWEKLSTDHAKKQLFTLCAAPHRRRRRHRRRRKKFFSENFHLYKKDWNRLLLYFLTLQFIIFLSENRLSYDE